MEVKCITETFISTTQHGFDVCQSVVELMTLLSQNMISNRFVFIKAITGRGYIFHEMTELLLCSLERAAI